jgi:tyrosine-protein kinase Etk/Wzc
MNIQDIYKELQEEENSSTRTNEVNYKLLIMTYIKKWHFFALGLLVCLGGAIAYGYFATPEYEITSKLLLKDQRKGANFTSNAVVSEVMDTGSSSLVENEAEVLTSENLMVKVFEELDISNAYFIPNGWLRWKEIYDAEVPIKVIIHSKNDYVDPEEKVSVQVKLLNDQQFEILGTSGQALKSGFGDKLKNAYGEFSIEKNPSYVKPVGSSLVNVPIKIEFYNPVEVGKYYATKLKVDLVNKLASVIELTMLDGHPVKGKQVLEKLIEVYNQDTEDDKNTTALNTIKFIDDQLVGISQELEDIEKQAEGYKLKNQITDFDAEGQLYLNSTTVNRQQLSELSIQIAVLESIEEYLINQSSNFETVPSSLTIEDPTLSNLIADFNSLQRERERMLRTTTANNPIVLNLNQQLSSLRTSILENLRNIKRGLEISKNNLQATNNQFVSRASKAPTMEREYQDISRKQGIKQEHYLYLVQKREEAALTLAAKAVTNSKIIQPPTPTNKPVSPKKGLIYVFGFIMGLALPIGFIFLTDLWHNKIQFKSDVEKITSTKILGEISRNKARDGIIAISKNKRTLIAEQFRFIRSGLAFSTYKKPNKIIMVTSGISGEGKTFFSVNFGISLGLADKKVVVLEFDLRRPNMVSSLSLPESAGLSEYLENDSRLSVDKILRVLPGNENVSIIGCGNIPENPAELMLSGRLVQLLEELSQRFDHIIIDTAPIGLVSDAYILAELADVTIFMLRLNYSTLAQVKNIESIRKENKFKMPLLVLNDSDLEASYGYGASYGKNYYQKS